MKKVLVIGGAGFVGKNVRISPKHFQLYSMDIHQNENASSFYDECYKNDVCTSEAQSVIQNISPDVLVVLAGRQFLSPPQKIHSRVTSFNLNVEIARSILRICSETPSIKKVIYVSTDMVYGKPKTGLITEETKPMPIGPYGSSKLQAETILSSLQCDLVVLRPRLIIGPGRTGTVQLLSKFVKLGSPIPIIGNGENRYQMISVFDVWSAIEAVIEQDACGVFNIGSDNPPTLNELLPKILTSLNRKNKILRLPIKTSEKILRTMDFLGISPLAPEQYQIASLNCLLDTSKIKSLGWTPKFSDEEMLRESLLSLI